jgi:hypothetical protein
MAFAKPKPMACVDLILKYNIIVETFFQALSLLFTYYLQIILFGLTEYRIFRPYIGNLYLIFYSPYDTLHLAIILSGSYRNV